MPPARDRRAGRRALPVADVFDFTASADATTPTTPPRRRDKRSIFAKSPENVSGSSSSPSQTKSVPLPGRRRKRALVGTAGLPEAEQVSVKPEKRRDRRRGKAVLEERIPDSPPVMRKARGRPRKQANFEGRRGGTQKSNDDHPEQEAPAPTAESSVALTSDEEVSNPARSNGKRENRDQTERAEKLDQGNGIANDALTGNNENERVQQADPKKPQAVSEQRTGLRRSQRAVAPIQALPSAPVTRRGPGRPRKNPNLEPPPAQRKRPGRPRKTTQNSTSVHVEQPNIDETKETEELLQSAKMETPLRSRSGRLRNLDGPSEPKTARGVDSSIHNNAIYVDPLESGSPKRNRPSLARKVMVPSQANALPGVDSSIPETAAPTGPLTLDSSRRNRSGLARQITSIPEDVPVVDTNMPVSVSRSGQTWIETSAVPHNVLKADARSSTPSEDVDPVGMAASTMQRRGRGRPRKIVQEDTKIADVVVQTQARPLSEGTGHGSPKKKEVPTVQRRGPGRPRKDAAVTAKTPAAIAQRKGSLRPNKIIHEDAHEATKDVQSNAGLDGINREGRDENGRSEVMRAEPETAEVSSSNSRARKRSILLMTASAKTASAKVDSTITKRARTEKSKLNQAESAVLERAESEAEVMPVASAENSAGVRPGGSSPDPLMMKSAPTESSMAVAGVVDSGIENAPEQDTNVSSFSGKELVHNNGAPDVEMGAPAADVMESPQGAIVASDLPDALVAANSQPAHSSNVAESATGLDKLSRSSPSKIVNDVSNDGDSPARAPSQFKAGVNEVGSICSADASVPDANLQTAALERFVTHAEQTGTGSMDLASGQSSALLGGKPAKTPVCHAKESTDVDAEAQPPHTTSAHKSALQVKTSLTPQLPSSNVPLRRSRDSMEGTTSSSVPSNAVTDAPTDAPASTTACKPPRPLTKRRRVRFAEAEIVSEVPTRLENSKEAEATANRFVFQQHKYTGSSMLGVSRRGARAQRTLQAASPGKPLSPETERAHRALFDELQYLLDGVFGNGKGGNSAAKDDKLVVTSLLSMLRLLRRPPRCTERPMEGTEALETDSVLLVRLREQPRLLQKLTQGLLQLRRAAPSVALLAMAALLVIVRGKGNAILFTQNEVEALVDAFFSCMRQPRRTEELGTTTAPQPRRRGRTARKLGASSKNENVLQVVKDMLKEEDILSGLSIDAYTDEARSAAVIAGYVLSCVLEGSESARRAMTEKRSLLGKVVSVLYNIVPKMRELTQQVQLEKVTALEIGVELPEQHARLVQEKSKAQTLTGVSMRILEFATLLEENQNRVVNESKVIAISLLALQEMVVGNEVFEAEGLVSCALKLCINLTHGCPKGLSQFVENQGVRVVINCLARESTIGRPTPSSEEEPRSFDVRVLSLALLASIVDQSKEQREHFQDVTPSETIPREGGALAFILELLKDVGSNGPGVAESSSPSTDGSEDMFNDTRLQGSTDADAIVELPDIGPPGRDVRSMDTAAFSMERKVTTGYLCLLIGALVRECPRNRAVVQRAMPENSLLAVAAVLDEFLEFHHDIGVSATSIDAMYDNIINALQHEEAGYGNEAEKCSSSPPSQETGLLDSERPSTGSSLEKSDTFGQKA